VGYVEVIQSRLIQIGIICEAPEPLQSGSARGLGLLGQGQAGQELCYLATHCCYVVGGGMYW